MCIPYFPQISRRRGARKLNPLFSRMTGARNTFFPGCAKIKTYVSYPVGKNMFKVRKITIPIERRSKNVRRIIASNLKKIKGIKLKILLVHSSINYYYILLRVLKIVILSFFPCSSNNTLALFNYI